jgi:putative ABC transport system permease protein
MGKLNLIQDGLLLGYITTAVRSLARNKLNSGLTLLGLSIGLAASILIFLFAINEKAFDQFQPNAAATYRMVLHVNETGNEYGLTTPRAFQQLKSLDGIDDVFYLMKSWSDNKVKIGDDFFKLKGSYAATDNISDFVSIDILFGDLIEALRHPDKIALSYSEAVRLFGRADVVGNSLLMTADNKYLTIAAVFSDIAENSHFRFDSLTSFTPYVNVIGNVAHTYIRLTRDSNTEQVEQAITQVINSIWDWDNNYYYLQPLLDIHLAANMMTDMKVGGSASTVYISIALSILLLLISSFNTINMSIAQAGKRAKEVGVRKVLGASKLQLTFQFLLESFLISLVSVLIACAIVELVLPSFNLLVGRQLQIGGWSRYLLALISIAMLIGTISGLYPALFISSFNSKRVLSGDFQRGKSSVLIRKSLMVLQSALSIGLMVAAVSLASQLDYIQKLPVNYDKAQQLNVPEVPFEKVNVANNQNFYQGLRSISGVIAATHIDFDLTDSTNAGFFIESIAGIDYEGDNTAFGGVGYEAVKTLGLKLVAGRDFSSKNSDWYNQQAATSAIIIPESLLVNAGYASANEAIGKIWTYSAGPASKVAGKIVGVIKDVKVGSVNYSGSPVVFVCGLRIGGNNSLAIKVSNQSSAVIKNAISEYLTARLSMGPVEIQSVEHNYKALYREDYKLVKMVSVFSTLAVFLTGIGIFGLAAFSAQKRNREVAIRKVIGASKMSIIGLISKESILLVVTSMLIAFPVAYYLIENWLNNFNHRITQSAVVYIAAGLAVTVIIQLTISVIAYRTASASPSTILRYE